MLLAGSTLFWPKCDLHITDVFVLLAYWMNLEMQGGMVST